MKENTRKELEEIFNDDLLHSEVIASVENEDIKAALIKWIADGTCELVAIIKPIAQFSVLGQFFNEKDAREYFQKWCEDVTTA